MPLVLRASHTHLYPGLRGRFAPEEVLRRSPALREQPCVVEFSDGRVARARLESLAEEGARLWVQGYRTAAGTVIARKRWLLEIGWQESTAQSFRVRRRLPPEDEPSPAPDPG